MESENEHYTLDPIVDRNKPKLRSSVVLNRERTVIEECMRAGTHLEKTEPKFWLDKVCIDQNNIGDGLRVASTRAGTSEPACSLVSVRCLEEFDAYEYPNNPTSDPPDGTSAPFVGARVVR